MRRVRGIAISILIALLMAGCIFSSVFADGSSSASNNWGGDMMGLTEAKAPVDALLEDGSKLPEIKIAVVDTGANAGHELLNGRILSESRSFINQNTSDYSDENGHGTHVAGIIAQNTPSNVKILVLQALDKNKKGAADNVANAIEYAADQGADIINLSLGVSKAAGTAADPDDSTDDAEETMDDAEYRAYVATIGEAIAHAKSSGCLIVAAAGNSAGGRDLQESQTYPAISDDVVTVSAISEDKSLYENSNYGDAVDFCAPGEDIYSAGINSNTALEHLSGTSMAAPFISSAFAMLKLYNPEFSANDLTSKLQSEEVIQDIGDAGKDPQYGYGLPVFEDGAVPHTKLPKPEIKKTTSDGETITLEWDAANYLTYDVYRCEIGTDEFACVASDLSVGQFVDEDVVLGTTYEYYIEAPVGKLYLTDIRSDTVKQEAEVAITSIGFYSFDPYIEISDSIRINYYFTPENATHQEFTWKSSDEEICSVDQSGVVTGLKKGSASIYISQKRHEEIYARTTVYVIDENNGQCGEDVNWHITEVDNQKTLVISGLGDMYNFDNGQNRAPWLAEASTIAKIIIEDGVTSIGENAFSYFTNLTEVTGMEDVIILGAGSFRECSKLQSITLPQGVEQIDHHAFTGCYRLNNVTFGEDLLKIGKDAFSYCIIQQLDLPEGLLEIGDSAFYGARITHIALPNSLTKIGSNAFSNTRLTEVFIPSGVTQIGGGAFQTKTMTGIEVSEENQHYCSLDGVLFDKSIETIISFPGAREGYYSFPETVNSISAYAFANSSISEVQISQGVSIIPGYAFLDCGINEIVLPEGLKIIDGSAFTCCGLIEELELPNGLEEIYNQAFYQAKIKKIIIPGSLGRIKGHIFWSIPELEEVVIGEGITELYSNSFRECSNLHSITIPSSIEKMGYSSLEESFSYCENIQDVYYCDFTKKFKSIENIDKQTNLIKDDVTLHIQASGTIGDGITWKAEGVSGDVTLTISGSGVIPDYTDPKDAPWYDGKDEITHVVIEDGVTSVGRNSFFRYDKIRDVTLSGTVQDFGRDAFRACNALEAFVYNPEGSSDEYRVEPQFLVSLYSGSAIEPGVYVSKDGTELKEETDYTLSYKNNTQIGQATIEVNFIGDHAGQGTVRIPFIITDKLLDGENIKALSSITLSDSSYEYNGSVRKPSAVVKSGRWVLRENADYRLDYSVGRKNIGTYKVVASGVGAYSGTKWDVFEICPASIANLTATLSSTSYTYDGKAKKPSVSVSGLTSNDYSVSYSDNTEVGIGTVTVSGKGNYTGQQTLSFTIKEAPETDSGDSNNGESNSHNSGSDKSGSKISGNSSGKSGSNASNSNSSKGTSSATTSAGVSTLTGSGASSAIRAVAARARTVANTASNKSTVNSSDETDESEDVQSGSDDDFATEDIDIAEGNDNSLETPVNEVTVLPDKAKYIAAGSFFAVAVAGTAFLILLLKKKKKKAA